MTEPITKAPFHSAMSLFFSNGYGLHDATWRDEFGGKQFTKETNGSHGCINLPYKKAEKLFNNISAGCTIVVFY